MSARGAPELLPWVADWWKPIETAPKVGDYLIYQPKHPSGRYALEARICLNSQAGGVRKSTHWMPLPPPPRAVQPSTRHPAEERK